AIHSEGKVKHPLDEGLIRPVFLPRRPLHRQAVLKQALCECRRVQPFACTEFSVVNPGEALIVASIVPTIDFCNARCLQCYMYCPGFLWVLELLSWLIAHRDTQLGWSRRPAEFLSQHIHKVGSLGRYRLVIIRPVEPRVVAHVGHVTTCRSFDEHQYEWCRITAKIC